MPAGVIMKTIEDYIKTIPDYPEPGIMFRDITTVVQDPDGLKLAIDTMEEQLKGIDFDIVVGAESRGFVFGMPLAYNMHKGFIMVRKKGKLSPKYIETSIILMIIIYIVIYKFFQHLNL